MSLAIAPEISANDPKLRPHFDDASPAFSKPRLNQDDVARYFREGFLIYEKPVLRQSQFEGLRERFELLLDRQTKRGLRPEAMDTPHFGDHKLFEWIFSKEILDLVEPLIGPDIALFSTHFIAKPAGNGRRVPWHEDSFYWKDLLDPMHVCTVWIAVDPSIAENGCMNVIPRSLHGYSEYEQVYENNNVSSTEIKWLKNITTDKVASAVGAPANVTLRAERCVLRPNECSLHDARLIHGSDANTSGLRRCGYTMRFIPAKVKYNWHAHGAPHQIYLARGEGHPANTYADPTKDYEDLFADRVAKGNGH